MRLTRDDHTPGYHRSSCRDQPVLRHHREVSVGIDYCRSKHTRNVGAANDRGLFRIFIDLMQTEDVQNVTPMLIGA
jgi:hypothetical protein